MQNASKDFGALIKLADLGILQDVDNQDDLYILETDHWNCLEKADDTNTSPAIIV